MGKLIVVKDDEVKGTDTHNVTGQDTTPAQATYTGTGDYDYEGKMTDQLSNFVNAGGKPAALKNSKSSLNPGQKDTGGKHSAPVGRNFKPPAPAPNPATLSFLPTELSGEGTPNAGSGSSFVRIDGTAILLDSDKIDTCDGTNAKGNSTVTAKGQDFVSCSE